MSVLITTTLGPLTIDLFTSTHPSLTSSFLKLCKLHYYDSHLFFNVLQNRFAQTGDPSGTGSGGMSVHGLLNSDKQRFIKDEGTPLTVIETQMKGLLVATKINNIKDTNGSQFMITTKYGEGCSLHDMGASFSNSLSAFGKVVEDFENVLDKLNNIVCDQDGRPFTDVRIIRTDVLNDPFNDPFGFDEVYAKLTGGSNNEKYELKRDRDFFDNVVKRPVEEKLELRISAGLNLNDEEGEGGVEEYQREEERRKKEAESRSVVLSLLGDLPSSNTAITAPENVLFICKLNPLTTSSDLTLIFSRFDSTASAEIQLDQITGLSLNYAFVEFKTKEACTEAYFKMNNALVDDRRIKVDFSQSVSGVWNKYTKSKREKGANNGDRGGGGGGGMYSANSNYNNNNKNNGNSANNKPYQQPTNPKLLAAQASIMAAIAKSTAGATAPSPSTSTSTLGGSRWGDKDVTPSVAASTNSTDGSRVRRRSDSSDSSSSSSGSSDSGNDSEEQDKKKGKKRKREKKDKKEKKRRKEKKSKKEKKHKHHKREAKESKHRRVV